MTASATVPGPEPAPLPASGGTIFNAHRRTQFFVTIASLVCAGMFLEVARRLHIPREPHFQGSLLLQVHGGTALGATYVLFVCALIAGTILAGRTWFFAGLFAAFIGLVALSIRGGPERYVLFEAAARGDMSRVFGKLLAEQCLLFLPVAVAWGLFWRKYSAAAVDQMKAIPAGASSFWIALATQTAAMIVIVLLLAPTDAKKQIVISVFAAGLVASMLADYVSPDARAPGWYWVGPFLAGAIGYLAAWCCGASWTIGSPPGPLANLARPLPLDFAGAGSAGALLGYWIGGERPDLVISLLSGLTRGRLVIPRRRPAAEPAT